ncbi:hypothetical protein PR048_022540 [Dryococelus australis]|uniref:Uncharacterized protein n=1 Tax=Dryococelus australis TaxID=614101 RepID=A0ABQ9H1K1_9NEOP|nr:hypothetical protein PR048_022540 [Dryococelus australis]
MVAHAGFLWVILCMLLVSAPCLGIGDKPRPPSHSTSTIYVQPLVSWAVARRVSPQDLIGERRSSILPVCEAGGRNERRRSTSVFVTRRQTRHPVCVTVQGALSACLPNVDQDLGQRPPGIYIQPSAPLRILPTAKALKEEGTPELEGSYRHPRYLHFGMFTPPTTGTPSPAISTEPLAEQDNGTGHYQPQQVLSTVTLTITRVEDVVDFRVTAILEAKNCVPVGARIPFCGLTGLQQPLPPHQDLPATKKKVWSLFGIQLPWPFNCCQGPDDHEPPTTEVNLEPAPASTEGPAKMSSSSKSPGGQEVTKNPSGNSHAQEQQKLVLAEDEVSGYLPNSDPAKVTMFTNSPGNHVTKNSPEHIHVQEQQESSLVGETPPVTHKFALGYAEETVSSSLPPMHNQEFGDRDYVSDDDVNTEQHTLSRILNSSPAVEEYNPMSSQSTDSTSGDLPIVSIEGQDKDVSDYKDFPEGASFTDHDPSNKRDTVYYDEAGKLSYGPEPQDRVSFSSPSPRKP